MNALFPTGKKDYALSAAITIPQGDIKENDTFCTNITLALDSKVEEEEERFSVRVMPGSVFIGVVFPDGDATVTVTIRDKDSKTNLHTKMLLLHTIRQMRNHAIIF